MVKQKTEMLSVWQNERLLASMHVAVSSMLRTGYLHAYLIRAFSVYVIMGVARGLQHLLRLC